MYVPSHFQENDPQALNTLISEFPLGTLITHSLDGLDANHIPFYLDQGAHSLFGHLARANPLCSMPDSVDVLVIFRAGDAYISPNWYPSKHVTHRQVPTWNYRVVHVHGKMVFHRDERVIRGIIARLTKIHEASLPNPWAMSDAPKEFINSMVQAIIGVEIKIERMVGKSKLSQNRSAEDIQGAAAQLEKYGEKIIGASMRALKAQRMP